MRRPSLLLGMAVLSLATCVVAAERIPPKPERYFNDYAGVVSPAAAARFHEQLAQFERETSNQVVVAVFKKLDTESDIADYAQRVFQAWQIGTREKRNGVLFIAGIDEHKMRIQTGYGLEGALPDIVSGEIIRNDVAPHFRTGDFEGGIAAAIQSIEQAIRGEYRGSGKTVAERSRRGASGGNSFVIFLIFIVIVFVMLRTNRRRAYGYSSAGGPFIGGWSGGGGGWSSGGNGFSGFSGGGGSSGGGGASGSW